MEEALTSRDLYGRSTVLFLDEIHRFTKAQQDALLPGVENGWVVLIAATTENPSFSVISPLLSRSLLLTLEPLTDDDLGSWSTAPSTIPAGSTAASARRPRRARRSSGSPRATPAARSRHSRRPRSPRPPAPSRDRTTDAAEPPDDDRRASSPSTVDRALLRYDRQGDEHYDVISAFIKSVRGSDVDAALHYLARMIEAGEDPRFIARRIIMLAVRGHRHGRPAGARASRWPPPTPCSSSACPRAASRSRRRSCTWRRRRSRTPRTSAIDRGDRRRARGQAGRVPKHLRDAHYPGAKRLGHGKGYRYPHDDDDRRASRSSTCPTSCAARRYYEPTEHGNEREVSARLAKLRAHRARRR